MTVAGRRRFLSFFTSLLMALFGLLAIATDVRMTEAAQAVAKEAAETVEPAGPIQRADVAKVYSNKCATCHDADGSGQVARKAVPDLPDFRDAKWQASRSSADFKQAILNDKGKCTLPMNDKLGSAGVDQMIAYIRGFGGGKQAVRVKPQPRPAPPGEAVVLPPAKGPPAMAPSETEAATTARIRAATVLYRQYCLSCHGADGRGSTKRAKSDTIPDFASRSWQEGVSDPQLAVSILDGTGPQMPAFRDRIREEQAQDLVAYIRAFGPPQTRTAQLAPSEFQKRFDALQQQWDALEKQLPPLSPPSRKP